MTPKQQRFIEEYLIDLNAAQAAIRAGYSKRTAKEQGYENLTKPHIAEAVGAAKAKRAEKLEITQEMVLRGLHDEAVLTGKGSSPSARVTAWTQLGKHLQMFTDNLNLGVGDGLAILLQAIADRPRHSPVIGKANGHDGNGLDKAG